MSEYTQLADMPDFLNINEVKEIIRVKSKNTIYNIVRSGDLPSFRFGREIRIAKSDLITFLDKHRVVSKKNECYDSNDIIDVEKLSAETHRRKGLLHA